MLVVSTNIDYYKVIYFTVVVLNISLVICGPILKLNVGDVEGKLVLSGKVHQYLGIPYAKPPVNDLRYQRPVPISSLPTGSTFNATVLAPTCMQFPYTTFAKTKSSAGEQMWNPNTEVSEDCLYINIWIPSSSSTTRVVLLWFFGGGFVAGTATLDLYNGAELANESGSVVITVNYRVGSFGFLTSGTSDAPSNNGLQDQMLAIKFINNNIAALGGNHLRIFGESSGAASIGYHLLMKNQSKFDSAVLQSGSPNLPWASVTKSEGLRRTRILADSMKCNHTKWSDLIRCLKAKSASDVLNNDWLVEGPFQFSWTPVVDEEFVFGDMDERLARGDFKKIPIVMGINEHESTYFLAYEFPHWVDYNQSSITQLYKNAAKFNESLKYMFRKFPSWPMNGSSLFFDSIISWINNRQDKCISPIGWYNFNSLDKTNGDFNFVCGVNQFADAYLKHNVSVRYYRFVYYSQQSAWPSYWGALHGDEIRFLFGVPLRSSENFPTKADEVTLSKEMIRNILTLSSDFTEMKLEQNRRLVKLFDKDNLNGVMKYEEMSSSDCVWWRHAAEKFQVAGKELTNLKKVVDDLKKRKFNSTMEILTSPLAIGLISALSVCGLLMLGLLVAVVALSQKLRTTGSYTAAYKI